MFGTHRHAPVAEHEADGEIERDLSRHPPGRCACPASTSTFARGRVSGARFRCCGRRCARTRAPTRSSARPTVCAPKRCAARCSCRRVRATADSPARPEPALPDRRGARALPLHQSQAPAAHRGGAPRARRGRAFPGRLRADAAQASARRAGAHVSDGDGGRGQRRAAGCARRSRTSARRSRSSSINSDYRTLALWPDYLAAAWARLKPIVASAGIPRARRAASASRPTRSRARSRIA